MQHGSDAIHDAQVERIEGLQHMHIPAGQTYKSPGEAYVEGDASSASYFLAGDSPAGHLISRKECNAKMMSAQMLVVLQRTVSYDIHMPTCPPGAWHLAQVAASSCGGL